MRDRLLSKLWVIYIAMLVASVFLFIWVFAIPISLIWGSSPSAECIKVPADSKWWLTELPVIESEEWIDTCGLRMLPVDVEVVCQFGNEDVVVHVSVDESKVGCKPGRKNVFATIRYSSKAESEMVWCNAIDKFTGVSFSSDMETFEEALKFPVGDEYYGVYCVRTPELAIGGQYTQQLVVNCAEDYDGVVFQVLPVYGEYVEKTCNSLLRAEDIPNFDKSSLFGVSKSDYAVPVVTIPNEKYLAEVLVDHFE